MIRPVSLLALVDLESGAPRLVLDSSVDSMLPEDDAGRSYFERVKELFDGSESILVVLAGDDIFTCENLQRIRRTTERIEELDQFTRRLRKKR